MDVEKFMEKVKAALAENAKAIGELSERVKKVEEIFARLTKADDDDDW